MGSWKDMFNGKMKNMIQMLLSVAIMGMGVAVLKMTRFGPDPCSALNYGMAYLTGLSLGTYQLLFNLVLFIIVIALDRRQIGLGTFGNMICVGYSADATSYVMTHLLGVTSLNTLLSRTLVFIPAITVFVFAAAFYMNSGLGVAPYDAVPVIVHRMLCEVIKKEIPFRAVRIAFDGGVALLAFAIKGEVGVATVVMVFALGPVIQFVGRKLSAGK